ncbi:MAG: hypothetical protein IJN90_04985 [Bacilli bacterium]|nr:hypothetical protein [Bacilli bacterium]
MGIIISGFSNIGKSSLSKFKDLNYIDFDTHFFRKEEGWEKMYVECLLALSSKYDYVFITTHGVMLERLNELGIEYYLVYPKRELKDEYKNRAISRNSSEEFVNGFFSRWDEHISDCEKNTFAKKIVLESGEYLSDVIDKIV